MLDSQTTRFISLVYGLPDKSRTRLWRTWSSAPTRDRDLMLRVATRLYDVRNAGHFDVATYADMARLQWEEIRRRGLFRRKDAESLLAYWDHELTRWYREPSFLDQLDRWILDQARIDDGEIRAWAQTRAEVKVRLPSPERTFSYRQDLERATKRLAIYLDGKRSTTDKPTPFTMPSAPAPLAPIPRPPPILLPPPPPPPPPGDGGAIGVVALVLAGLVLVPSLLR